MKSTFYPLIRTAICIVLLLCLLWFQGCQNHSDIQTNTPLEVATDSVMVWIKNGNDISLSITDRKEFLEKAYREAQTNTNDSLRTRYFSQLSLAYLRMNDSFWFRKTNQRTMNLSRKIKDTVVQAEAHWDLATFFKKAAVEDSAYYHYGEAQKIFNSIEDNFSAGKMLYNMAVVQANVKDYTGSEITTIKAIEQLRPLDKYMQLYKCYNNLGSITKELKEYDKSIEYYRLALDYLDKADIKNGLQYDTENNIGIVYQEQGNHKEAKTFFNKVVQYDSLFYNDTRLYAKALSNLAYNKSKLGDTTGVLPALQTALKIRDSINDIRGVSLTSFHLAEHYLTQKDTANALTYANNAKATAEQSSNYKRLLETLKLFPRIDPANATTYIQEYIALNDQLQMEERKTRNKFARIRFETDEFIEQNQLLAKQRQLWIGIATGLFLLAGAVTIIVYQRVRNQKLKFQQQQQESNQEIFDLMLSQKKKVEEGKQSEQKRISEELHDGILGQMNGIRMMLLGLNKKTDETAVAQRLEVISKLQDVQEEVRTISHELNHASYQKFNNFILSIQDLLKTIGESAQMEYQFHYDEDLDWDDLNGDLKINVYRMVQESLQNCVKHAKAKQVVLDFDTMETQLKISITDDGAGFDMKKGKRGIGLKNITSRVQKLNGTWDINSKIGKGTTVTIVVPLTNERPEPQANIKRPDLQNV
ncbi:MAG: sensor histidine kinase [Saonia sp.]